MVTEADIYQPKILDKVTRWVQNIEDIVGDRRISAQVELLIHLEGKDCAYYFVDHSTRAQFWIEDIDTTDLGLSPIVSLSQLSQW